MGARFMTAAWMAVLVGLALITGLALPWAIRRCALFWLGCAAISASAGLVEYRVNLLLLPIWFFSLALMTVPGALALRSRPVGALLMALLYATVLAVSASRSAIAQEYAHPENIWYLYNAEMLLWGEYSGGIIPAPRQDYLEQRFAALGIRSHADFEAIFPNLVEQARETGRDRPGTDGALFLPRIDFWEP